jgi:hypothetical protein
MTKAADVFTFRMKETVHLLRPERLSSLDGVTGCGCGL